MKLVLAPSRPAEWIARWLNLGPIPAGCAFYGMMAARALMAGERLGLYARLAGGAAAADEIARERAVSAQGVRALLDALVALEVVDRSGDLYSLRMDAARWLSPSSPRDVRAFLRFNYAQWGWWTELENAIRTGRSIGIHSATPDDPVWSDYVHAMFALARTAAPEVARRIPVPRGATRLLDVGGAHGWYAAELCRRHRSLHATVIDLEGSVRVGREIIAHAGMADRVDHRVGDVLAEPLGEPADVVLLFQILHHVDDASRDALLARVKAAVKPGGVVALMEPVWERSPATAHDVAALVNLHYFLTSRSGSLSQGELERLLERAGFAVRRPHWLRRLPMQMLVIGSV